ncbi:Quorum-quenching protein AidA [Paraconexibacter sp. AEG42_29]|uniref:Quorum-quenching protein AidA n=1 Tax=Paraconexibacter sp. AEG42_29 TaxID=2997339 RepID=A0AAU7ARB3_9ACTN
MREDIEFVSGGVTLRGWFFTPDGASGEVPCIVMAHGFAAVKEMHLDEYAAVFTAAGLACVVHDHPGFGASDVGVGKPRQEIDPWEQVRGFQDAITYAQGRPEVDASRIGVWGSSYGGAHAYVVAAVDRRVKAVCGQVPLISGRRNFETLVRVDFWDATWQLLAADRLGRANGDDPITMPVVHENPLEQSALPTADSYEFFTRAAAERAPSFVNEVTARSLELFQGYEPGEYLKRISPTPLLMVVAPLDRLAPGEWACEAYETAAHPKKLVLLPGGHFDAYTGDGFERSSGAARDWFVEHLLGG